jgi:hypothetical protein
MFQTERATSSGAPYLACFWRDVGNSRISVAVSHISQQKPLGDMGHTFSGDYQYALSRSGKERLFSEATVPGATLRCLRKA